MSIFLRGFRPTMSVLQVGTFEIRAGEFVAAQKVNHNESDGPENSADSAAPSLFARGPILLTQKLRSFVKMAASSMRWMRAVPLPS